MTNFFRNVRGVAAIEFAFVGPIFFIFLFMLFGTPFYFFASQTLEAGVLEAARQVSVGNTKDYWWTLDLVCVKYVSTCGTGNVVIDVFSYNYNDDPTQVAQLLDPKSPIVEGRFDTSKEIIVLRAEATSPFLALLPFIPSKFKATAIYPNNIATGFP